MPLDVPFGADPHYDFHWPKDADPEKQIILNCRRLTPPMRTMILNMQTTIKWGRGNKGEATTTGLADVADKKINCSVLGWEGVLKDGEEVKFSIDKLKELRANNAGQTPRKGQDIEGDLLDEINKQNNLALPDDDEDVSEENSGPN